MFVASNLYQSELMFVNKPDFDCMKEFIEKAIENYNEMSDAEIDFNDELVSSIKKNYTPVIFGTTVSRRKKAEFVVDRLDFNERARRSYLVIDADFDEDEVKESVKLLSKIEGFIEQYKCKAIIYPTISFPDKPRFRVYFFLSKLLSEREYRKAMMWLYSKLESEPTDRSDLFIKSNNNAPFFINDEQLDFIQIFDEGYETIDYSKEWGKLRLPKNTKKEISFNDDLDTMPIDDVDSLYRCVKNWAASDFAKDYDGTWPLIQSLVRSELSGQLSRNIIFEVLELMADYSTDDKGLAAKWTVGNMTQYHKEYRILQSDSKKLDNVTPLLAMKYFGVLRNTEN